MKYLLVIWLVLLSSGCSVTEKKPAIHDFGTVNHQDKASVSVNAPTWLWDNRIRYRLLFSEPSQVRFYGLDRWIASPPELLEQLLTTSGMAQDYVLLIRLHDFEQQFDAPDRARVVLRFFVEAYSVNNKQKIATQEFYLQQPTKTPDADGAINGFTDLAKQATENIQAWLVGLSNRQR
ncbi:MAG TPA: hypothetical protein VIF37_01165 [Methylobacter sp.]|jgi:cholesterol transport system auxiliary component